MNDTRSDGCRPSAMGQRSSRGRLSSCSILVEVVEGFRCKIGYGCRWSRTQGNLLEPWRQVSRTAPSLSQHPESTHFRKDPSRHPQLPAEAPNYSYMRLDPLLHRGEYEQNISVELGGPAPTAMCLFPQNGTSLGEKRNHFHLLEIKEVKTL